MPKLKRYFLPEISLMFLAVLPYCFVLQGDHLYDDIQVIRHNTQLMLVTSLQDAFAYTQKPTRPISDLFLALGEWLTPRRLIGQRVLSLVLHALSTLFLWKLLLGINQKMSKQLPTPILFAVPALFAFTPVQSEAVLIAQYRMDILGTFFSLFASWSWLKKIEAEENARPSFVWKVFIFLSFGGAALSKEPYALIAPALLLLVLWVTNATRAQYREVAALPWFWWALLVTKLRIEPRYGYPFSELLGYKVISPFQHLMLSGHALAEGAGKLLTGQYLTIVRLMDRMNFESPSVVARSLVLLLAFSSLSLGLLMRRGWSRLVGGMLLICVTPYLLIPNINIGSEHYLYPGTAAVWLALSVFIWRGQEKFLQKPRAWFAICFICFSLGHLYNLKKRLGNMRTRLDFYLFELKSYPSLADRWIDLAAALVESPRKDHAELARTMLDGAAHLNPKHPLLLTNEYYYSVRMGDRQDALKKYKELMQVYHSRPEELRGFRTYWKANFGEEPG